MTTELAPPHERLRAAAMLLRTGPVALVRADLAEPLAAMFDQFAWMGEMNPDWLWRVGCDEVIALADAVLAADGAQ